MNIYKRCQLTSITKISIAEYWITKPYLKLDMLITAYTVFIVVWTRVLIDLFNNY